MRDLMTSTLRRVRTGWFWPLVLLALPNCAFQTGGIPGTPNLNPGPLPHGDAIMCDIEQFQGPGGRRCASQQDIDNGTALGSAAIALVTGQEKMIGLDYSSAAFAHCGAGNPEAIDFQGPFPAGFAVCVNCGQSTPADAPGVCVAECKDLLLNSDIQPPDRVAFCTANARPSTNFPKTGCFTGACSAGGTFPAAGFTDPRLAGEQVVWDDAINTTPAGNNLAKSGGSNANFDAGAVSDQWIALGDGYVEFEANESSLSHVIGLALVPAGCTKPTDCHDMDPSIADIDFAINLNIDGRFYILENGNLVNGGDINNSWGTYMAHQRFRVTVKDKHDGTYDLGYSFITGMCIPGNPCNETIFHTHNVTATYPLRVDTSFRELNAELANVTIVRIQQ
jgi:hypothetical protein